MDKAQALRAIQEIVSKGNDEEAIRTSFVRFCAEFGMMPSSPDEAQRMLNCYAGGWSDSYAMSTGQFLEFMNFKKAAQQRCESCWEWTPRRSRCSLPERILDRRPTLRAVSVMGRCRDCRWWEPVDFLQGEPRSGDAFDLRISYRGWGNCDLAETEGYTRKHETLAIAPSDYRGSLTTSPDFGCVQFERAER